MMHEVGTLCTRLRASSHNFSIRHTPLSLSVFYHSMSTTASSSEIEGVVIPSYSLVTGALMHALEHAASIVATHTDDDGEAYAMQMVRSIPAADVPANSMVVIPLDTPQDGVALDFTFLASCKSLFFQVHEKPQARMTNGHCANFSAGTLDRPVPIGALLKFPSLATYLVAQPRLLQALRAPLENVGTLGAESAKRPCLRPLEVGGERTEDATEKPKGMSIVDLDGGEHPTRNKTDLHQRERDLWCTYRIMDTAKHHYSIRSDVTLNSDYYLGMLIEQGETQVIDRHPAFLSCGLMNRIQKLPVLGVNGKLRQLLIGSVHADSNGATLSLEDFISGEKIACKPSPCPSNNAGLVTALKNLQMVMQVCFSDVFERVLESFIDKLEGVCRPMELVPSDFLKHSVQLNLRKFFREVSTVKGSALQADLSLKTPELCAAHLTSLFAKLAADLSDHPLMVMREAHFRIRANCILDKPSVAKSPAKKEAVISRQDKPPVASVSPAEDKKEAKSRPCVGHLGHVLDAVTKDGRPYVCRFGKDCSFRHLSIDGKSKQSLLDIVGSLTAVPRADLMRAVVKRP